MAEELVPVELIYEIDGEPVRYTQALTRAQIAELLADIDEMAYSNEVD